MPRSGGNDGVDDIRNGLLRGQARPTSTLERTPIENPVAHLSNPDYHKDHSRTPSRHSRTSRSAGNISLLNKVAPSYDLSAASNSTSGILNAKGLLSTSALHLGTMVHRLILRQIQTHSRKHSCLHNRVSDPRATAWRRPWVQLKQLGETLLEHPSFDLMFHRQASYSEHQHCHQANLASDSLDPAPQVLGPIQGMRTPPYLRSCFTLKQPA